MPPLKSGLAELPSRPSRWRDGVASRWVRRLAGLAMLLASSIAAVNAQTPAAARAAGSRAEQLLAEIQRIMRTTDFTNEAAATAAEARIKALSDAYEKEMTKGAGNSASGGGGATRTPLDPGKAVLTQGSADLNALVDRIVAAGDEFGDFLMAEPVQAQLRAEFKEEFADAGPGGGAAPFDMPIVIDVAAPDAQRQVARLRGNTKSTMLIITSSQPGQGLDAGTVLAAARQLPLRSLYLVRLGTGLRALPAAALGFARLETLSLYGNALNSLPDAIGGLVALRRLDVDLNPIPQLPQTMGRLTKLRELNLVKTRVDSAEYRRLRRALPSCTVRLQ